MRSCIIKILIIFITLNPALALAGGISPYSPATNYLFEVGQDFYNKGRYQDALSEFKKVLIINPDHEQAIRYIDLIKRQDDQPVAETVEVKALPIEEDQANIKQEAMEKAFSQTAVIPPVEEPSVIIKDKPEPIQAPEEKYELSPGQFIAYTLEKPPEDIKLEKDLAAAAETTVQGANEKPAQIPLSAMPSVDLKGRAAYTYIDYNLKAPYRSLATSLYGKYYDFNLRYESLRRDINGKFDHDYTYLNLVKPGLFIGLFDQYTDLNPLRGQQYAKLTGLKVVNDLNAINKMTFLGGETETTVSGLTDRVKYLGNVYGVKDELRPRDWIGLKGGLYYFENRADLPNLAGTSSFPRQNLLSYYDLSLKFPYDLGLSATLANAYYEPDDSSGRRVQDLDWRVGSEINKKRYRLGVAYEFVGDEYASFNNPDYYRDYSGWDLYGNYQVNENWALYSSANRYHDNVRGDPDQVRTENTNFNLTSYHRLGPERSIAFNFSRYISDPSGPDSGPSSKANLYRIDYSVPFFAGARALFDYQYYRNDISDKSGYYAHTVGSSIFRSFGRGSSWYFRQQLINNSYKQTEDSLIADTSFNINYLISPLLSVYFNSAYDRNMTRRQKAVDTFSGATGFSYSLFTDTTLNGEYAVNSYDPKAENNSWPRNWSILLYISQGFNISSGLKFGGIEGYVFLDANGNGQFDSGDSGASDVILRLEDGRQVTTDARGYFKFSYVAPGAQRIFLDQASLPVEWASRESEKVLEVKPRKNAKVNFALTKSLSVYGRVFVDQNSDSVFEETEEPLEDIAILLSPGEQVRRTNTEGIFKFEYLLPGKYKVKVNEEDLPVGYELVSSKEIEFELLEGTQGTDINFPVRIRFAPAGKQ